MAELEWKGTGTEQDPWKVESIEHLLNMSTKRSEGKYFKLTTDLDFNNYNDGIFNSRIGFSNLVFDGDGHTIKNIQNFEVIADGNLRDKGLFEVSEATIKNTHFESIYCATKGVFRHWTDNNKDGLMENCTMSVRCKHFTYYFGSRDCFVFKKCTISILSDGDPIGYRDSENSNSSFSQSYTGRGSGYAFDMCNIKVSMINKSVVRWDNYPEMNFSKLEITNIEKEDKDITIFGGGMPNTCCLILDAANKETNCNLKLDQSNIYDSTLWGGATDSTAKGLTTADMKSAKKLQAAGFPVVAQ